METEVVSAPNLGHNGGTSQMKKSKIFAAFAAGLAALGGLAAFLANIDNILTKPVAIATKAGFVKSKPTTVDVSLASLTSADAVSLVFGKDNIVEGIEPQPYGLVGGVYCVPASAMGHCPGETSANQTAGMAIRYDSDSTFSGPFGPAVPIFDVASVRPDERDILLVRQRVEFERVAIDTTPYVELIGLDDNEGRIELVSHCLEDIASVELKFRIEDVAPTDSVDAWMKAHPVDRARSDFPESVSLNRGSLFGKRRPNAAEFATQTVDLRPAILRRFPGKRFRQYPEFTQEEGEPPSMGLEGVKASWLPKPFDKMDEIERESAEKDLAVMIVGEMRVTSRSGQTYHARFRAPVVVSSEKGYGAGGVVVDSKAVYLIDGALQKGSVSKPVKLVLNDANPTVRSQAALLFKRSGRYRVRFVYSSSDKPDFMASDWITVQAFASPNFVETYLAPQEPGE